MEVVKADEDLTGRLWFDGAVKGSLSDLRGTAKAKLNDGSLFGVKVDTLSCSVNYADGRMRFTDGTGRLYGGSAKAEAMITLPAAASSPARACVSRAPRGLVSTTLAPGSRSRAASMASVSGSGFITIPPPPP